MMPLQRRLGRLIFLLMMLVWPAIPTFAFQNEPAGFRGIKWGTNISELHDMYIVEDVGDLKFYTRVYDRLRIEDADIERINYGFYKNRFYRVEIRFSEFSNFMRLKTAFFSQFGEGGKPHSDLEDYWWIGSTVNILMSYNEITYRGGITLFFRPINEEKAVDDKQKAKKGARNL